MIGDGMIDRSRLEDIAWKIKKTYGVAAVAEQSGVKPHKVSRFVRDQTAVTMSELNKIQHAVEVLEGTS